jgi:hypothetical protein
MEFESQIVSSGNPDSSQKQHALGSAHLVSANASGTEPAELIAVFVADEGAQLTTFIE